MCSVCVSVFARLRSSNPSQNRIGGGGGWPSSIFDETSPPYRISITSDDLFSFLLPLFRSTSFVFYSSSLAPVPLHLLFPFVPPLSSGVSFLVCLLCCPSSPCPSATIFSSCHTREWYSVASLVALTSSQLDPTTWTAHILSSFYEFALD